MCIEGADAILESDEYKNIDFEIIELNVFVKWLRVLYGSKSAVDTLNDAANGFFSGLQRIVVDWCVNVVVRLVNDRNSRSLTFARLVKMLPDGQERTEINAAIQDLAKKTEHWKTQRDKRIAHLDREYAKVRFTPEGDELFPGIAAHDFFSCIDRLTGLMNKLNYLIKGRSTDYKATVISGDVTSLLHVLEEHSRIRDLMRRSHNMTADDFRAAVRRW
jgi:hypothetical protein